MSVPIPVLASLSQNAADVAADRQKIEVSGAGAVFDWTLDPEIRFLCRLHHDGIRFFEMKAIFKFLAHLTNMES